MKPKRIQLSRKKGWRLPPNTAVVARGPGRKWGNPYKISVLCSRRQAVEKYEAWLHRHLPLQFEIKRELRGKNLACFCPESEPCHGNLMLEIANTNKLV